MDIIPLYEWGMFTEPRPSVVAGPCSAESEEQIMETAKGLKDLGIKTSESGIQHIAVCEGKINKKTLERLNIYKEDIMKKLEKQKVALSDVYMMLIDDAGKVEIIKK